MVRRHLPVHFADLQNYLWTPGPPGQHLGERSKETLTVFPPLVGRGVPAVLPEVRLERGQHRQSRRRLTPDTGDEHLALPLEAFGPVGGVHQKVVERHHFRAKVQLVRLPEQCRSDRGIFRDGIRVDGDALERGDDVGGIGIHVPDLVEERADLVALLQPSFRPPGI